MRVKTTNLEQLLKNASEDNLDDIVSSKDTSEQNFSTEIKKIMEQKQLSKGELINKTLIDRSYGYQILQGTKKGGKDKIIQFCLALSCTLKETNRLLTLSQNPILYAKLHRDQLLIYALEHHLTVMKTNELLAEHDETMF